MNKTKKPTDWHPADIKARLAKKKGPDGLGYTFARIARENGYVSNAPNTVLRRPWPKMELIVGGIIGVKPQTIWPSRYDKAGNPIRTKQIVTAKRKAVNV